MDNIYIVISGGCLRYVSTDSEMLIKNPNLEVTLIDFDNEPEADETAADAATRIW